MTRIPKSVSRWAVLGAAVGCLVAGCSVETEPGGPAPEEVAAADGGAAAPEIARREQPSGGSSPRVEIGDGGALGLLAPTVPGFILGGYSADCEPYQDPYGVCL